MRAARLVVAVLLGGLALSSGGCGSDHPVRDLEARAEQARERLKKRVREVLDDLQQAVPQATPQTRTPASRGRTETNQVESYLDEVLASVDRY